MAEKKDYDQFRLKINANDSIETTHFDTANQEYPGPEGQVDDSEYLRQDIRNRLEKLGEGTLEGDQIQFLGRDLYRAIFPGRVGEFFDQTLQNVLQERDRQGEKKDRWLRVIIDVHPKSSVFAWPLEFLFCPRRELWLATERSFLALSRHLTLEGTLDLSRQAPPLRALVIISDPTDLRGVISAKVLEEIGQLANTPSGGEEKSMDVKVLGRVKNYQKETPGIDYLDQPAKYENITDLIKENWRPHVLHFIGHGKFDQSQGFLGLMKDEEGREVDWTSADDISQLFSDWKPRLVLLQACQSAQSGTEPGFMSLADRIFKRNIPAVVAMQYSIANDYATIFAHGFYEALRDGKDVDAAVQIGRSKITAKARWAKRDFGAPVLFTYRPDAIMQPITSRIARTRPSLAADKPNPSLSTGQRVARKIENALKYLEDTGGEVDVDRARTWMDDVIDLKDDSLVKVKNIVSDARECLDMQEIDGAIKRLKQALRSPELKLSMTDAKPTRGFESGGEQPKLPPKGPADRGPLPGRR
ncbi:MAG: CHAT domain-containing protein [Anaerolineales bacterium]|nr:CHAT domain-containing protein [Anaerolineales bacterium]